jgi:hypothetical protein
VGNYGEPRDVLFFADKSHGAFDLPACLFDASQGRIRFGGWLISK